MEFFGTLTQKFNSLELLTFNIANNIDQIESDAAGLKLSTVGVKIDIPSGYACSRLSRICVHDIDKLCIARIERFQRIYNQIWEEQGAYDELT